MILDDVVACLSRAQARLGPSVVTARALLSRRTFVVFLREIGGRPDLAGCLKLSSGYLPNVERGVRRVDAVRVMGCDFMSHHGDADVVELLDGDQRWPPRVGEGRVVEVQLLGTPMDERADGRLHRLFAALEESRDDDAVALLDELEADLRRARWMLAPKDGPALTDEAWERQLSATRAALRTLCDDLGLPNDWPDDLHLADVVEKYIGDPLTADGERTPAEERADVVAWLREMPGYHDPFEGSALRTAAETIEAGDHVGAAERS